MKRFIREHSREISLVFLVTASYVPSLIWMWDRWFARDSYYTHGILIPFVSLYLVWQQREELTRIPPVRSRWGMPLIVTGLLIHVLSSLLRVYFSSAFSILLVLWGIVLHFYGKKVFWKIVFPLLFLFFMIPLPLVVIVNVSFKMKLLAADIAARVLNNIGLMALRDGSVIRMSHGYVIVDDICSGLRSLISLAALGSIFTYWLKASLLRKSFLLLATVPIAIIANVGRVVFLAFVSEIWGASVATGVLHTIAGFIVFALAILSLTLVAKLLE